MWYEVKEEFNWKDQRGNPKVAQPGELVDILSRSDANMLLKADKIQERFMRRESKKSPIADSAPPEPEPTHTSQRSASQIKTGAFRVKNQFDWHNQRGQKFVAKPGELVDILNRHDAERLLAAGLVGYKETAFDSQLNYDHPAPPFCVTKRIGMWIATSSCYSGGRIHMYQYAWTLADMGCEVWIITNTQPLWARDYPPNPRLHIAIAGKDKVPVDLDMIVTDSKEQFGKKALDWKNRHPHIPIVCFNFETPNWVANFDSNYAGRLQAPKDIFSCADYLVANSGLSKKYLLEWLDKATPCGVLNPAVNTFALGLADTAQVKFPKNPYAVYSARSAPYKGASSVIKSIWKSKKPFDIVAFGTLPRAPKNTDLHNVYNYRGGTDAEKFALMKNAEVVLAPSKFEGYGMVPGEALAAGTPCIVYDLPVLRKAYGDNLQYVKWGDENEFVKAVNKVIDEGAPKLSEEIPDKIIMTKGMESMASKVESLKFHSMRKKVVSAHMICYWGFVPEAMEAIYPYVDQVVVAYGPTELNRRIPEDGSLERLQAFPDPENKIKIEARKWWNDKKQMRQWCTNQLHGNYHLLLDADEIWVGLDEWLKASVDFSCPRWLNFWHDEKHWVYDTAKMAGLRWGRKLNPFGSTCPHYRWSRWRSSYYWRKHPTLVDRNNRSLHCKHPEVLESTPGTVIYHLGHALPKRIMQAKHEFYRRRDGDNAGRISREDIWHKWNGKLGDIGDGIVAEVDWELPDIVTRAMKSLRKIT